MVAMVVGSWHRSRSTDQSIANPGTCSCALTVWPEAATPTKSTCRCMAHQPKGKTAPALLYSHALCPCASNASTKHQGRTAVLAVKRPCEAPLRHVSNTIVSEVQVACVKSHSHEHLGTGGDYHSLRYIET